MLLNNKAWTFGGRILFSPLGSTALEKSRFARYFETLL
jgi:hypothetical protein